MADDDGWSIEEGETKMLEVPKWLAKERSKAVADVASKRTMAINLPGKIEAESYVEEADYANADDANKNAEATALLDVSSLYSEADDFAELKTQLVEPQPRAIELSVDGKPVKDFPFEHLVNISEKEKCGIDAFYGALGPAGTLDSLTDALARRMEDLIGRPHQVSWIGVGGPRRSEELEFDDGVWIWGRMPPEHNRFVVGAQRRLTDAWLAVIDADEVACGDDFEFGVVSFVVAEFCAVLGKHAGWPPWAWAVNPLALKDLQTILLATEGPVLEVAFMVSVDDSRGVVQLCLPLGLIHRLRESTQSLAADSAASSTSWWRGLSISRPLVVGSTRLRVAEWERLAIGDVMMVERHGVELAACASSAVVGGGQWRFGEQQAVTGNLRCGEDGSWCFEVVGTQVITDSEEVKMSEDVSNESGEMIGVSVEAARMEMEVRVGSLEMELSDISRLRQGQVIDCEQPLGSPVELVVRGTQVGTGELVNIDGKLGVRILSMTTR